MKIHHLERSQFLPVSLEEAWDFFSTPKNLQKITPDDLEIQLMADFKDEKMYPGQIINYIIKPILNIPVRWTTEITHVDPLKYFVDEQRFGPYSFWHHKHFFEKTEGGVLMTDSVHYALPLGILGSIAHGLFVKQKLRDIFDFRYKVLEDKFSKKTDILTA